MELTMQERKQLIRIRGQRHPSNTTDWRFFGKSWPPPR